MVKQKPKQKVKALKEYFLPGLVILLLGIAWLHDHYAFGLDIQLAPQLVYSSTELTSDDVTVTIMATYPIHIQNNNGSTTYTFAQNGSFTFAYTPEDNNDVQTVTAHVRNIDKAPPLVLLPLKPDKASKETWATFGVDGVDVVAYKYNLDDQLYSELVDANQELKLEDLPFGDHTIKFIGQDTAGNWTTEDRATSYHWRVLTSDEYRPRVTPLEGKPKLIEISIAEQHMWVYDGKKVIYHTPVTTGANGLATERGDFAVSQKHLNKWFDGGYFSKYWMRFNKGMGMHDATWRHDFGSMNYTWNGSHGCVNVPTDAAIWLYDWTEIGTPVSVI